MSTLRTWPDFAVLTEGQVVALATARVEFAEASPKPSLPDCFETPGQETGCEPDIALRKCIGQCSEGQDWLRQPVTVRGGIRVQ